LGGKKEFIETNPCKGIARLAEKERDVVILTPTETARLFAAEWDSDMVFLVNKPAAFTGMRIGELLGLRSEFVHDDFIEVRARYNTKYGYGDVKNHKPRNVPIPAGLRAKLETLIERNGTGYVFSANGGETPVKRSDVSCGLSRALENIGIDCGEQKKRHLTLHSGRHYLNTTLVMAGVGDSKVMAVTGHQSLKMKAHYTHIRESDLSEVRDVQEKLPGAVCFEGRAVG
jgi:integrase